MADTRCPKDLKSIITSNKDPSTNVDKSGDQVIEELAKLKGLSHDEKTESAMLRSRIEEQCDLIMILKNRVDEVSVELKTSERIRKSLEDFREHAQSAIDLETKKCEMLDMRFNELAENHQELIKFKDQYKIENERLRQENEQLRLDNERLFSGALQEKQEMIDDLESQLTILKSKCETLEQKSTEVYQAMIDNRKVLQERLDRSETTLGAQVANLEKLLAESEQRLRDMTNKYKDSYNKAENTEADTRNTIVKLTKERDELLELVMQRGKIIEEKVSEIRKLENKVEESKKRQKEAEERFEKEAAAVDSNLQVIKLKKELLKAQDHMGEVDKKFEAYKTHTNKLLQQERDLNAKLRHLTA